MSNIPVAYQLYSVREEAQQDLERVFAHLHALGYDGVEFAGLFDWPIPWVRKLLDQYELRAISSHVQLSLMERDMSAVLSQHAELGCQYITVPHLDREHRPGGALFSHTIALFYRLGELCRQAGMTLLFHNHFCEFERVSGQYGLDFLYDAVPAELLQTQLDVCWITYAGEDPLAYLRKYAGRSPVVHLKDFVFRQGDLSPYEWEELPPDEQNRRSQFAFCPWGYGRLDVPTIYRTACECGARWFVVEQDYPWEADAMINCEQSMRTIKSLRAQAAKKANEV